MFRKPKHDSAQIQLLLKALADRVPAILSIGLVSVDGIRLGFYSKNPNVRERRLIELLAIGRSDDYEEDRASAMSAAIYSLSERIASELRAGDWAFSVIAGKQAKIFELAVGDKAVLIVIAKPECAVDMMLPELEATARRFIDL